MSNLHNERYDEIKSLLKRSKLIFEQSTQINVAKDLESRIKQDNEYEISLMTNLSEARGHHVAGGLGGAVTNVGHQVHPLELPSHPVVDTLQKDNYQSELVRH